MIILQCKSALNASQLSLLQTQINQALTGANAALILPSEVQYVTTIDVQQTSTAKPENRSVKDLAIDQHNAEQQQ